MSEEIIVLVTCPTGDGMNIAKPLIEEQLAACVNVVGGIKSIFQWDGKLSIEAEEMLVIKTSNSCWQRLEARIKELHSYDVPEIVSIAIENGYKPYLDWLNSSLTKKVPT